MTIFTRLKNTTQKIQQALSTPSETAVVKAVAFLNLFATGVDGQSVNNGTDANPESPAMHWIKDNTGAMIVSGVVALLFYGLYRAGNPRIPEDKRPLLLDVAPAPTTQPSSSTRSSGPQSQLASIVLDTLRRANEAKEEKEEVNDAHEDPTYSYSYFGV